MSKPPFTMSKYASQEDLLSDAASYYEARSKELEHQRDELLAALKVIRGAAQNANNFRDLQLIAHEAIEKAEKT